MYFRTVNKWVGGRQKGNYMKFKITFTNEKNMKRVIRYYKTSTEVIYEAWQEIAQIALKELDGLRDVWYMIDSIEYVGR